MEEIRNKESVSITFQELLNCNNELKEIIKGKERQIERQKRQIKELKDLALRDTLTGLFNGGTFNAVLKSSFATAQRFEREENTTGERRPVSVIAIDLDGFKQINDKIGHSAGDTYLKVVAKHLSELSIRPTDIVARPGGDEFAIIIEGGKKVVQVVADRIPEAIKKASGEARKGFADKLTDEEGHITASIGCASSDEREFETSGELSQEADARAYIAKQAGRNAVVTLEMAQDLDEKGLFRAQYLLSKENT